MSDSPGDARSAPSSFDANKFFDWLGGKLVFDDDTERQLAARLNALIRDIYDTEPSLRSKIVAAGLVQIRK